jgi:hypothetical protein
MGKSNRHGCTVQLHEHVEQEEECKEDAPVTYMPATRRLLCSLASRAQHGGACQRRRRRRCSSLALPAGTAIPAASVSSATLLAGSARLVAGASSAAPPARSARLDGGQSAGAQAPPARWASYAQGSDDESSLHTGCEGAPWKSSCFSPMRFR